MATNEEVDRIIAAQGEEPTVVSSIEEQAALDLAEQVALERARIRAVREQAALVVAIPYKQQCGRTLWKLDV